MKRGQRSRRITKSEAAVLTDEIDRCLTRFYDGLFEGELKLADYMKLAELSSIAGEEGEEAVVVRWVECEETDCDEDEE